MLNAVKYTERINISKEIEMQKMLYISTFFPQSKLKYTHLCYDATLISFPTKVTNGLMENNVVSICSVPVEE